MKVRRRGTTRVSGPGQYRSARCSAALSRGPATAETCSQAVDQHRQGHLGRPLLQREELGHRPRAGTGPRPARRRCRWAPPPPHRPGGPWPPAPATRRPPPGAPPAWSSPGHHHADPPGQILLGAALRANPARRTASSVASAWAGSISTTSTPGDRSQCGAPAITASMSAMPAHPAGVRRHQGVSGLPPADRGIEAGELGLGHVGGVGHHEVHRPGQLRRQGVEPPTLGQPDPGGGVGSRRASSSRFPAATTRASAEASVAQTTRPGASAPPSTARERAMAPDPVPRSTATGPACPAPPGRATRGRRQGGQLGQGHLHHLLGLRPRDEHPPVHGQVEGAERPPAQDVLQGLPRRPPVGQGPGPGASPPVCSTIQRASRSEPTRSAMAALQSDRCDCHPALGEPGDGRLARTGISAAATTQSSSSWR